MTASQRKLPRPYRRDPHNQPGLQNPRKPPTRTACARRHAHSRCLPWVKRRPAKCRPLRSSAEKPERISHAAARHGRVLGNPRYLLNFPAFPGAIEMTAKPAATALDSTLAPQMAAAIRALSMDAVQRAKSGHPGMPMGMAEIAVALWGAHLRHNPADPRWPDLDRFVLSN